MLSAKVEVSSLEARKRILHTFPKLSKVLEAAFMFAYWGHQNKDGMDAFAHSCLPRAGSTACASFFLVGQRWTTWEPRITSLWKVACINLMLQSTADVNAKAGDLRWLEFSRTADRAIYHILLYYIIFVSIGTLSLDSLCLGGKAWLHPAHVCGFVAKVVLGGSGL